MKEEIIDILKFNLNREKKNIEINNINIERIDNLLSENDDPNESNILYQKFGEYIMEVYRSSENIKIFNDLLNKVEKL